jgi:hypothetical protein
MWLWRFIRGPRTKHGLDEAALIALRDIRTLAPGGYWQTVGDHPQLYMPFRFAAGWIRLCLAVESAAPVRIEVYADYGSGFEAGGRVAQIPAGRAAELDHLLRLAGPAQALRIDLIGRSPCIRLHSMRVSATTTVLALARATLGKVRLARKYGDIWRAVRRALALLLHGRIDLLGRRLLKGLGGPSFEAPSTYSAAAAYDAWRRQRALTGEGRERLVANAAAISGAPLISVILPVAEGSKESLPGAVASVLRQAYPHWEMYIIDDGCESSPACRTLDQYGRQDSRVHVVQGKGRNATAVINHAISTAKGDFVTFLGSADRLAEHALYRIASAVIADPNVDLLYSDEDRIAADGRHVDPFFKPGWSPEYLLAFDYVGRPAFYRTELVRDIGGWRSESEADGRYDLTLRTAARTNRVHHIPDVLYHVGAPTAEVGAGACLALHRHLDETGRPGAVESGPVKGTCRVRFQVVDSPLVSIIIPTAAARMRLNGREQVAVLECVRCVRDMSSWTRYEILVVGDERMPTGVREELVLLGAQVLSHRGPFNFSSKINLGAGRAAGSHLLLLNDDTEVINPDWLECLLEYSQQPDVGAVGAKLLLPHGRIQHAGVHLLAGKPVHAYYGYPDDQQGWRHVNVVSRNCCAVTGACLMTRADVFREAGGLDPAFPLDYGDIDYCLKVRAAGRRIVFTPYAQLYHHEALTRRGDGGGGRDLFQARWSGAAVRDPFYNPNLCDDFPDYRINPAAPDHSP